MSADKQVPISPQAGSLLKRLSKSGGTVTVQHAEETDQAAFPDLPASLIPERQDGTGKLNRTDIDRMQQTGALPLISPRSRLSVYKAVKVLEEKLQRVTQEFTKGTINQEQFEALFIRYGHQKAIIDRLLNSKKSAADQQPEGLIQSITTSLLRAQHAAYPLGVAIIDHRTGALIKSFGAFDIPAQILGPALGGLRSATTVDGVKNTQIEGGRWLSLVAGQFACSIALFSREPAAQQVEAIFELHRYFERENKHALELADSDMSTLNIPHAQLFD